MGGQSSKCEDFPPSCPDAQTTTTTCPTTTTTTCPATTTCGSGTTLVGTECIVQRQPQEIMVHNEHSRCGEGTADNNGVCEATFKDCNQLQDLMMLPGGYPMSEFNCNRAKDAKCIIAHTECGGCSSWGNLKYSDVGKCESVEIKSQHDRSLQSTKKNVYFLIDSGADRTYNLETKNAQKVEVYVGSGNGNKLNIKYTGTKPTVKQHIGSGEGIDTCWLINARNDSIREACLMDP